MSNLPLSHRCSVDRRGSRGRQTCSKHHRCPATSDTTHPKKILMKNACKNFMKPLIPIWFCIVRHSSLTPKILQIPGVLCIASPSLVMDIIQAFRPLVEPTCRQQLSEDLFRTTLSHVPSHVLMTDMRRWEGSRQLFQVISQIDFARLDLFRLFPSCLNMIKHGKCHKHARKC